MHSRDIYIISSFVLVGMFLVEKFLTPVVEVTGENTEPLIQSLRNRCIAVVNLKFNRLRKSLIQKRRMSFRWLTLFLFQKKKRYSSTSSMLGIFLVFIFNCSMKRTVVRTSLENESHAFIIFSPSFIIWPIKSMNCVITSSTEIFLS